MIINLSKVSPTARQTIIKSLDKVVCQELRNINDDLIHWEADGSIHTDTGKEMVAWRDALVTIRSSLYCKA